MRSETGTTRRAGEPKAARAAFTMVELLVVMGVVIMLLGILIVAVAGANRTAQATNTRALMTSLKQGLMQFRQDIGYLPPVLGHPDPDTSLPPDQSELRTLYDPRGQDLNWATDADNVLPEQYSATGNPGANGFYTANVQEWYSVTTLAEYLLGYGSRDYDGYGIDAIGNYGAEQPPLGIRHPGTDGVWGATIYGAANGTLGARMQGPAGAEFDVGTAAGKVYGPYLELKDEHLLAATDGSTDAVGRMNLLFPGDAGFDPELPKVILDYWGNPIRYYRRLYAPGALESPYRPVGVNTRPPTLSDVFVLRPFEVAPGNAIDGRGDYSLAPNLNGLGDTTTTASLSAAEFALFSRGPDGLYNPFIRYDSPDDPANDPFNSGPTSFANEDNIVELGP